MDFITTQNINIPANYENYGFVKIFRKKDPVPKLNLKISQGAYGLLCLDNFILSGDFSGHIHFIDIEN